MIFFAEQRVKWEIRHHKQLQEAAFVLPWVQILLFEDLRLADCGVHIHLCEVLSIFQEAYRSFGNLDVDSDITTNDLRLTLNHAPESPFF